MPFIDPEKSDSVLTYLETRLWGRIQRHWRTGDGGVTLLLVAAALRKLQAGGINHLHQLKRGADWYVEPDLMPRDAADALRTLLEEEGGGQAASVHRMMRAELIPQEERLELLITPR